MKILLTWDWKEYTPIDQISEAVTKVSGGSVHLYEVDTGSDQFAVIVSSNEMTEAEVAESYDEWREHR